MGCAGAKPTQDGAVRGWSFDKEAGPMTREGRSITVCSKTLLAGTVAALAPSSQS